MNADLAAPAAPAGVSQRLVAVLENVAIARDTYRLRLDDPILARAILPGPFLMIRPAVEDANDPLLGRPFALYDVTTDAAGAAHFRGCRLPRGRPRYRRTGSAQARRTAIGLGIAG